MYFNVFLNSGSSPNSEWYGGLNLEETNKREKVVSGKADYSRNNLQTSVGGFANLSRRYGEIKGRIGYKRFGGLKFRNHFSEQDSSTTLGLYGKLPNYVAAAGGILTSVASALSLYTNSSSEYRTAVAIGIGTLVTIGLKLLFDYLGRRN